MELVKGTLNHVELLGWLGSDPDMRSTPKGTAVCQLRLATKRPAGRSEQGSREYETEWISIEAWERLAERCHRDLHKGSRILVYGSLRNDTWEDAHTGQRRYRSFVRADQIVFLDGRNEDAVHTAQEVEESTEDVPF